MTPTQEQKLSRLLKTLTREWPNETVAEWARRTIIFREPGISGPFTLYGRQYMAEPLNLWKGPECSDLILCWAARSGKTRMLLIGAAWRLAHHPMRALWCKPALHGPGGARNDARTKWLPMLQASPALSSLLPTQHKRSDLTFLQQCIAGSIIDWTGTGSARQLAGNPCDVTIQDEIDGYVHRGDTEAHPSALIDERTKDCPLPLRVKTSTPTIEEGLVWDWLLRSDLRRRFLPCPLCSDGGSRKDRYFVLGWSDEIDLLPRKDSSGQDIPIAWMHWDNEEDIGEPPDPEDLRIAEATAHVVCPHCGGRVGEEQKLWMDDLGEWRATRAAVPGIRGYHLSSLYVSHPETRWGKLVQKFLMSRGNHEFLRNFINSDLALPWASQTGLEQRVTIIGSGSVPFGQGKWTRLMTVDCQHSWPYFWYVVRAWRTDGERRGDSVLIAQGHADTWDELNKIREQHGVPNSGVMVDSGFGAREFADVYRECFRRAASFVWKTGSGRMTVKPTPGARMFPRDGWIPAKGFPSRKRWRHKDGKTEPYRLVEYDPFIGTTEQGKYGDNLFEFAADFFADLLESMRSGKSPEQWAVQENSVDKEYWRHMAGQIRDEQGNWKLRSRRWPDHLLDCEKMQVAFAYWLKLLSPGPAAPAAEPAIAAVDPDKIRKPEGSSTG